MSFFVQSTFAPQSKTQSARAASIALAGILVVLAVAQLYSYEDFPDVIAGLGLHGGRPLADVYAALLVTGEVLALPFLLSMRLSPVMRIVSMVIGWWVIIAWVKIAVTINVSPDVITNSGILGATIPVAPSWWVVCFFVALAVMSAWASWGLWPFADRKKHL